VLQFTAVFGVVQASPMPVSTRAVLSHSCGNGSAMTEPLTPDTVLQTRRPRTGVVVGVVVTDVVALVVGVVVELVVAVLVTDVVAEVVCDVVCVVVGVVVDVDVTVVV
jgi:hypothetical protein